MKLANYAYKISISASQIQTEIND